MKNVDDGAMWTESPLMKLEKKNKYSIVLSLWLGATLSDTQHKSGDIPKREGPLKSTKPQKLGEQMHLITSQKNGLRG